MATFTPYLNLRKPASTDLVTVASDLDANMDILDADCLSQDGRLDTLEALNAGSRLTAVEAKDTALEAAWLSFTHGLSGGGVGFTIGNGSVVAQYKQVGKTVLGWYIRFTAGSTSVMPAGNVSWNLPVAAMAANFLTGTAIMQAPNNQSIWRNNSTTACAPYLVGTAAVATVATMGLANGSILTIAGGAYEVP